jgi:hypothetical protein
MSLPQSRGRPRLLGGAAASSLKATAAATTVHTTSSWTRRGPRDLGPVARSRSSGGRLAASTATPTTRTSSATHGVLAMATGALHRPFSR